MLCNIMTPLLLTKRIFSISNLDLNFEAVADLSPLLEDDLALVLPQPSGVGDDHGGADAVPDQHVQVLVHLHQDLDNFFAKQFIHSKKGTQSNTENKSLHTFNKC